MTIEEIIKTPRSFNNVHESIYRSYHILDYVLTMVERGDSKETILEIADALHSIDFPEWPKFETII